jgi:hypothetical protein
MSPVIENESGQFAASEWGAIVKNQTSAAKMSG